MPLLPKHVVEGEISSYDRAEGVHWRPEHAELRYVLLPSPENPAAEGGAFIRQLVSLTLSRKTFFYAKCRSVPFPQAL